MAGRGYVDKRGNKRQYSMIPFVGLGILVVLLIVIIVGITSCAKGCSNKGDTNEIKPQTTTTAKATATMLWTHQLPQASLPCTLLR